MNKTHSIQRALFAFCLLAVAGTLWTGCSSFKARQAPFYIYNSSLLNEDVTPQYPRDNNFDPFGPTAPEQRVSDTRVAVSDAVQSDTTPKARDRAQEADETVPTAPVVENNPEQSTSKTAPKAPSIPSLTYTPPQAAEFIRAIYQANGVSLDDVAGEGALTHLYSAIKRKGTVYHATRPAVGDVIFFHNTFDRNRDSRNNDWYTHAGLVEGVEEDGTIHVLSYLDGEVRSFPINLEHPKLERDERNNKLWNSPLRTKTSDDPPFTQYLGGELFAGFGSILGSRTEIVVIDNWKPGMLVEGPK